MSTELPKAPIKRTFKETLNEETRVSPSAIIAAASGLHTIIASIATQSEKLAKHAGRKTITDTDVNHALEMFIR